VTLVELIVVPVVALRSTWSSRTSSGAFRAFSSSGRSASRRPYALRRHDGPDAGARPGPRDRSVPPTFADARVRSGGNPRDLLDLPVDAPAGRTRAARRGERLHRPARTLRHGGAAGGIAFSGCSSTSSRGGRNGRPQSCRAMASACDSTTARLEACPRHLTEREDSVANTSLHHLRKEPRGMCTRRAPACSHRLVRWSAGASMTSASA